MNAHPTTARIKRIACIAIAMLGLTATTACEEGGPGSGLFAPSPEVVTRVSTDAVRAGEEVKFELMVAADADRPILRATIRWDAARFDYVRALSEDGSVSLTGEPALGWITLESRRSRPRPEDWIVLIFVALRDTDTSGFSADATLYADMEELDDIERAPHR